MTAFQPAAILALARRTLRAAFETPAAWAALLVFYLSVGYLFLFPLFLIGEASIRGLLDFTPLLLTLLSPALTMGLLSEELRSGTFETLATLPLEDWDIVLGKFLGFAALLGLLVAGLLFFPLTLSWLSATGSLDWGQALGLLGGLALQGLALGAIGIFSSSLTRSQAVAFLTAFLLGFALFACGKMAALLPSAAAGLAELVGFDSHLETLAKGVWDTRDLVYFFSLIAGFLFMAVARLEAARTRLFSAAGAAAVLAALVALNAVSQLAHARWDLSAGRVYSLSPATKELLAGLTDTVVVKVYFSPGLPPPFSLTERYLRDLLGEYRSAGRGRLRLEFLDPERDDGARRQAREAGVTPVQINVTARDRFESKEAWMGVVLLYGAKSETLPVIQSEQNLEYELTRKLKRLASPRRKAVGFLVGHGEKSPEDAGMRPFFALASERLEPRAVSLSGGLPQDLDALWIAGPSAALKPAEISALKAWAAGGKTLVVLDNRKAVDLASFRALPLESGLEALLSAWGLSLGNGLVTDAQAEKIQMRSDQGGFSMLRVLEYPFVPLATRLNASHPVTAGLHAVSFPFVQPVFFDPARAGGGGYSSLADSSRLSALADAASVAPGAEAPSGGRRGPFSLAGVAEGPAGRLALVGTSYQLDARLGAKASSVPFLLNLLDWSCQDESLLSIRGKGLVFRPLRPLPDASRAAFKYLMLLMLPSAVLSAAALLSHRRRARLRALPALYADV